MDGTTDYARSVSARTFGSLTGHLHLLKTDQLIKAFVDHLTKNIHVYQFTFLFFRYSSDNDVQIEFQDKIKALADLINK